MAVMEGVSRGVHLDAMVERGICRVRVVRWWWFAGGSGAASGDGDADGSGSEARRRLGAFVGGAFCGLLVGGCSASLGDSGPLDVRGRPRRPFCFGSVCEGPASFCAFETDTSARDGRPRFGF